MLLSTVTLGEIWWVAIEVLIDVKHLIQDGISIVFDPWLPWVNKGLGHITSVDDNPLYRMPIWENHSPIAPSGRMAFAKFHPEVGPVVGLQHRNVVGPKRVSVHIGLRCLYVET